MKKKSKKNIKKYLNSRVLIIAVIAFVLIAVFLLMLNHQMTINMPNNTVTKKTEYSKNIRVSYDISYKTCDSSETYIFACSLLADKKLYEDVDDKTLTDEEKRYNSDFFYPIINLLTMAKKEGYYFDVNEINYSSKNKECYIVISSNKFEKNKILNLYYKILDDFEMVNKVKDIEEDNVEDNLSINKYKFFKYIETEHKSKAILNTKINNIFSFLFLNTEEISSLNIKNKKFEINFNLSDENKSLLASKVNNIKSISYLTNAKFSISK